MTTSVTRGAVLTGLLLLGLVLPQAGLAQNPEGGDVQVSAQTRLQARGRSGASDIRLGIQARVDAFNWLGVQQGLGPVADYGSPMMPIVAPGVRFVDQRLYLGLGLGFAGYDVDTGAGGGGTISRSSFSFAPMAMFDVLRDDSAALSLGGWLNLSSIGETEACDNNGGCASANDDRFGWGLNLVAGVRGILAPGLSIGGEFGWGFLDVSSDQDNNDDFIHGLIGSIVFEASLGL